MSQFTYDEARQRGQAVIDAALPLRDEADKVEKQAVGDHPAGPLARDAHLYAHWAFRDAQDAMHMVSEKVLTQAELRLKTAQATLDKAKEALGAGDSAAQITQSTPEIPDKYIRAFISDRAIMLDEADAPIAAFVTRGDKPFIYDAWTKQIREHWTSLESGLWQRPEAPCP